MSATTEGSAGKRLSIPLSAADLREIGRLRVNVELLDRLPGSVGLNDSEAKIVHAIFAEGLRSIKEQEMETAYAEMADEQHEESEARRKRVGGRSRGKAGIA